MASKDKDSAAPDADKAPEPDAMADTAAVTEQAAPVEEPEMEPSEPPAPELLAAAQRARINGTGLDGAGGAHVLGLDQGEVKSSPTMAAASRESAQANADKQVADEKKAAKSK